MLIRHQSIERLKTYFQSVDEPCVAIFDVGTRATRLLVAPKNVPTENWNRSTFFNDAIITNLGFDIQKVDALQNTIVFMKEYKKILQRYQVFEEDISAVGTAVFRWIDKSIKQEVLNEIIAQTGIEIIIIEDREEAAFSLTAIEKTYGFRRGEDAHKKFDKNDVLILLDQGGGSMEVSYQFPADRCRKPGTYSFDEFGTIALRKDFFMLGAKKNNPQQNDNKISTQNRRIKEKVRQVIQEWEGYPKIQGKKLHAYGMGSAITRPIKGTGWKIHNKILTIERMRDIIKQNSDKLEQSNQKVSTLYKLHKELEEKEKLHIHKTKLFKELDNLLVTLYGLPAYIEVLKKFGLKELRICGYGLRYGVYIWKYHYKYPFPR